METHLTRGERTRAEIVQAAHDLFVERGYHGTSMRQIARRAGVALGGIYNHFDGKEDLFEAVVMDNHPYHQILPALETAQGDTVEALVRDAARLMLEALGGREDFLNLMFIEIVEFESSHVPRLFESVFPEVMDFVRRVMRARGELRPIPLPVVVRAFLGLFFSYFITELLISQVAPPDFRQDALDHFVDIYLHGILAGQAD